MTTDVTPWQNVGEPTAGFFASDSDLPPGLPYEQVVALRSLELAERAEEQRRQEELAERRDVYNVARRETTLSRRHQASGLPGPSPRRPTARATIGLTSSNQPTCPTSPRRHRRKRDTLVCAAVGATTSSALVLKD